MLTPIQLKSIFIVAAIVSGILLMIDGTKLPVAWQSVQPFLKAPAIVMIILLIFNQWIWRWRLLHPLLVPVPDLSGTWKGQLTSNFVGPNGKLPPKEVFLVVRQTFSTLHLTLITDESRSILLSGAITKDLDGTFEVTYTFRNTPQREFQDRSPIHLGGAHLRILGAEPYGLVGHYWTDRHTDGTMTFTSRSSEKYHDCKTAQSGKYKSYTPGTREWYEFWRSSLDEVK